MPERPPGAGKNSFSLVDADRLFSELALADGGVFLDLACGPGGYSLAVARRFPALRIHALDLAPDLIAGLREEAAAAGLAGVRAVVADIRAPLPLDDGTVDSCLLAMVVHDLAAEGTAPAVLREVRRVLKPGGRLAVVEFHRVPPPPGPPLPVRLEPVELQALLAASGFGWLKTVDFSGKTYLSLFRLPGG